MPPKLDRLNRAKRDLYHKWSDIADEYRLYECVKGPLSKPQIVISSPHANTEKESDQTNHELVVEKNGSQEKSHRQSLKTGIPDAWTEYDILKPRILKGDNDYRKIDFDIVQNLDQNYQLYFVQGIPDPWKKLTMGTLEKREITFYNLKQDLKKYLSNLKCGPGRQTFDSEKTTCPNCQKPLLVYCFKTGKKKQQSKNDKKDKQDPEDGLEDMLEAPRKKTAMSSDIMYLPADEMPPSTSQKIARNGALLERAVRSSVLDQEVDTIWKASEVCRCKFEESCGCDSRVNGKCANCPVCTATQERTKSAKSETKIDNDTLERLVSIFREKMVPGDVNMDTKGVQCEIRIECTEDGRDRSAVRSWKESEEIARERPQQQQSSGQTSAQKQLPSATCSSNTLSDACKCKSFPTSNQPSPPPPAPPPPPPQVPCPQHPFVRCCPKDAHDPSSHSSIFPYFYNSSGTCTCCPQQVIGFEKRNSNHRLELKLVCPTCEERQRRKKKSKSPDSDCQEEKNTADHYEKKARKNARDEEPTLCCCGQSKKTEEAPLCHCDQSKKLEELLPCHCDQTRDKEEEEMRRQHESKKNASPKCCHCIERDKLEEEKGRSAMRDAKAPSRETRKKNENASEGPRQRFRRSQLYQRSEEDLVYSAYGKGMGSIPYPYRDSEYFRFLDLYGWRNNLKSGGIDYARPRLNESRGMDELEAKSRWERHQAPISKLWPKDILVGPSSSDSIAFDHYLRENGKPFREQYRTDRNYEVPDYLISTANLGAKRNERFKFGKSYKMDPRPVPGSDIRASYDSVLDEEKELKSYLRREKEKNRFQNRMNYFLSLRNSSLFPPKSEESIQSSSANIGGAYRTNEPSTKLKEADSTLINARENNRGANDSST